MLNLLFCTGNGLLKRAMEEACIGKMHRMKVCERGMEVLQTLSVLAVDLVVLDGAAPGCGTPFLLEAIQRIAPGVPVIVVSTGRMESDGDFRRAGVVPQVIRADVPETLREVIDRGVGSVGRDRAVS